MDGVKAVLDVTVAIHGFNVLSNSVNKLGLSKIIVFTYGPTVIPFPYPFLLNPRWHTLYRVYTTLLACSVNKI